MWILALILKWTLAWFMKLNEWKHLCRQFLLLLRSLCLIVLFFFLYFCILSHFKIIKCFVKSLIATSIYFLLKWYWKKKIWKVFVGFQRLGTQIDILVSQTASICQYEVFFKPIWPSGLGNNFRCKRITVQTLLSLEFAMQTNLEHHIITTWDLAQSWSISLWYFKEHTFLIDTRKSDLEQGPEYSFLRRFLFWCIEVSCFYREISWDNQFMRTRVD